jgi:hypothetical protein
MASAGLARGDGASWRQAHEELVRLATERAGLDFEEGRWLLRARRSGAHVELGFASFNEYTERLFGYGPRLTQDKLRVAEALEVLPETARDLQTGAISFSHARELTRVAMPSTEREWLDAARGRTVRDVERLVSGHRPGSLPNDFPDPGLKRHVLRLELSGDVLATFREAMVKIRRDAGEPLDEEAAILLLCRQALEGSKDSGRSSYQIALMVCESCRRAQQQGRGELLDVGPEIVQMAECDGQHIGNVNAHVDASDDVDPGAHVGGADDANGRAHLRENQIRATQAIPPARRRAVLRRDGEKCRVPGCRHATFIEPHHIELRSEGGNHDLENLITLCGAHHRAVHQGRLVIAGTASSARFAHSDGTPYGGATNPGVAHARAKAFQALRNLGFREGEAKRALSRIPSSVSSPERLIRQALRELAHH